MSKAFCWVHTLPTKIITGFIIVQIILVAARSKTSICGLTLAGIAGSNRAMGMDVCHLSATLVDG
jgi:hypothetical protein